MAWLERKGTLFRIRFRFGGRKLIVPLNTEKEREANGCLARFGENLRLAERGRLTMPDDADIGLFLLSDGKVNRGPQDELRAEPVTLAELFVGYRNLSERPSEARVQAGTDAGMGDLARVTGAARKLPR